MVAYNYQEPTKQFTQELRFNGSENLALKNGFKLEGLLRHNFRDNEGNLLNLEYYCRFKKTALYL